MGQKIAIDERKFYFNGSHVNKDSFVQYNKMLSDVYFIYGIDKSTKLRAKTASSSNTFYYQFGLDSALNVYKTIDLPGASHGDDTFYIFKYFVCIFILDKLFLFCIDIYRTTGNPIFDHIYKTVTPTEIRYIDHLTNLFANFAKTGYIVLFTHF